MTNIIMAALLFALQGAETDLSRSPRRGDRGQSYGILQIQQLVIEDVNRIQGTRYTTRDALVASTAREICSRYLEFWGAQYTRDTGKQPTSEVLARIWNGGPHGWQHRSTKRYWTRRVQPYLKLFGHRADVR